MNMEMNKNPGMSKHDVLMELSFIKQQMNQGGRIDSENYEIDSIIDELTDINSKILPEEALRKGRSLLNRRQDFEDDNSN